MQKHGLRVVFAALMGAVGLMAFSASAALGADLNVIDESETSIPGFFLVSSGTERPTGLTKETVAATGGEGRLLILSKSLEIDCEKFKLSSASIANDYENLKTATMKQGGHGSAEALFENCKVFSVNTEGVKGMESAPCTKVLNGEASPHNISANGLLRVVRHQEGEKTLTYLVIEPSVTSKVSAEANEKLTSTFTTITFGGTCSLPSSVNFTGGIAIKAPTTDANKPELAIKTWEVAEGKAVRSAEQKLLGPVFKFGTSEVFLENTKVMVELTGIGKALSWGAMGTMPLASRHQVIVINGITLTKGTVKALGGKQEGTGALSIPAKSTELRCEQAEIINATAENEEDTKKNPEGEELTAKSESGLAAMAQGKVEFSSCKVFTFKIVEGKKTEIKESAPCTKAFNEKNKNAKGEAGHPVAEFLVLVFLHLSNTGTQSLIGRVTQPAGKSQFAILEFGGLCPLPEKVSITGGLSGEIPMPTSEGRMVPVKFESETAKGKELNAISETKMLYGASEAFIEGKVNVESFGNEKWGVM